MIVFWQPAKTKQQSVEPKNNNIDKKRDGTSDDKNGDKFVCIRCTDFSVHPKNQSV